MKPKPAPVEGNGCAIFASNTPGSGKRIFAILEGEEVVAFVRLSERRAARVATMLCGARVVPVYGREASLQ